MQKENRSTASAARLGTSFALAGTLTALAVTLGAGDLKSPPTKEQTIAHMIEIGQQIGELRSVRPTGEVRSAIARLTKEYQSLSAKLGGDDPAQIGVASPAQPAGGGEGGLASAPAAPTGCTPTLTAFSNLNPVAIPVFPAPPNPVTSTITVSGMGSFLWDVNLTTFLTHPNCPDLDITLQSPAGTIVTITTDNGSGANNFNGTVWNDGANPAGQVPYTNNDGLATDHLYATGVVAATLAPEEALGAFFGEDPNGVWTLTMSDDTINGSNGSLNSWSLDITTAPAAPATTAAPVQTNGTPVAIPTTAPPTVVSSTITVSGLDPVITDLDLMTAITHTFNGDLDMTLQSPAGTVVTITSDNGSSSDNVYNGTVWNDDADPGNQVPYVSPLAASNLVTDTVYTNLVVEPALVAEEGLAAFIGEDPNGTWTLTISDDANGDGGSLASWSIDFDTTTAIPALTTSAFTNTTPVGIDATLSPATAVSTILVSGAGTYLWDLDLSTTIAHSSSADLDITLQSPAGTVVTLTTDNGGTNDDVFNGTAWDDDSNPLGVLPYTSNNGLVGDQTYANLTTATPLVSEEALGAFIGEDPNGTWTLTINDDTPLTDGGSLNAWSMSLTTLDATPTDASTLNVANSSGAVIATTAPPQVVTQTVAVSGAGTFLRDVNLNLNITHTFTGDLDITLTSPAGTIVTVSTDNGGVNDNVFAGTTFDDDADPDGQVPFVTNNGSVTDHAYVNLTPVPLLTSEEALAAFIGEDPNGTWTLTISDDATGDGGNLVSWSLDLITCECSVAPPCPADTNNDGQVNVTDLLAVIGQWGPCLSPPCSADINNDGQINVTDLLAVIGAWGACP